jgi:DNA-binding CsgD family transcriptional regulator
VGLVVLSGFGPRLSSRDPASAPLWAALRGVVAWARADRAELQRAGIQRAHAADPAKYVGGKRRTPAGAIRALLADGFGPTQIARILKIGRRTVYNYLPADYRRVPKPKREPRQPIDARTVQVLVAAGVRTGRIAESLGCSKSSVRRLSRI